jgi:anti-anti-sigma regulatory factor
MRECAAGPYGVTVFQVGASLDASAVREIAARVAVVEDAVVIDCVNLRTIDADALPRLRQLCSAHTPPVLRRVRPEVHDVLASADADELIAFAEREHGRRRGGRRSRVRTGRITR